jgi:hypothetical protein
MNGWKVYWYSSTRIVNIRRVTKYWISVIQKINKIKTSIDKKTKKQMDKNKLINLWFKLYLHVFCLVIFY